MLICVFVLHLHSGCRFFSNTLTPHTRKLPLIYIYIYIYIYTVPRAGPLPHYHETGTQPHPLLPASAAHTRTTSTKEATTHTQTQTHTRKSSQTQGQRFDTRRALQHPSHHQRFRLFPTLLISVKTTASLSHRKQPNNHPQKRPQEQDKQTLAPTVKLAKLVKMVKLVKLVKVMKQIHRCRHVRKAMISRS
jgi:hypothetical protein